MTFLQPGYLFAALAAAVALVAAHLIAWRQPPDLVLPTARFVPDETARHSARAIRLADVSLLLLRVGIVLLAGAALARPVFPPMRRGTAQLIAADLSREVADPAEVRDSVNALRRDGIATVLIGFDSVARPLRAEEIASARQRRAPGALSSLLVTLEREASRLALRHEHVEIAIVSPLRAGEFDAATLPLRALLRDSIRLVRVRGVDADGGVGDVVVRATGDDPVAAGVRLGLASGVVRPPASARVIRDVPQREDSNWVSSGPHVLLWWPADSAVGRRGSGADHTGTQAPAVRGVTSGDATLIGHLEPTGAVPGEPVAYWLDGTPAVSQAPLGEGCVRRVGFDVPRSGDLTLTTTFQRLAAELLRPCTAVGSPAASDSLLRLLAEAPGDGARVAEVPRANPATPNRAGAMLLLLAIGAGMAETVLRRRRRTPGGETPHAARGIA